MSSTDARLIEASGVVHGWYRPGYESVVEAFGNGLILGLDIGAAFAVYRAGDCLIDVWGGQADLETGRPWEPNTVCPVFSGTKGLIAVCLAKLIERNQLDLNSPVAAYWPEFGKRDIRVRHVVSHASRLPGVTQPVTIDDFLDERKMAEVVAAEPLSKDPRARLCYHPFTFGWICAEMIRRIDGRALGEFFADEVARPLGLQIWIGLPRELEPLVAKLNLASSWVHADFLQPVAYESDLFQFSIWANPKVLTADSFIWNDARVHAAGVPGAGAVGTARAMAQLYDGLPRLLSPEILELVSQPLSAGSFGPLGEERRFGVGFQLANHEKSLGPTDAVIGHTGAGGSLHGRWLQDGLGFSYIPNQLRGANDVPRGEILLSVLRGALR